MMTLTRQLLLARPSPMVMGISFKFVRQTRSLCFRFWKFGKGFEHAEAYTVLSLQLVEEFESYRLRDCVNYNRNRFAVF